MELARETSHACPLDSRVDDEMEAPARNNQSESFLSSADKELRLSSSLVKVFRSFVPPGVVGTCRGCFPEASRCVLDLLFGRVMCAGFFRDTREVERERIEGVVGADLPSIYDTW